MKLGPFEISFELAAALTLLVYVIWLGFSSGQFTRRQFWSDFIKSFLQIAVIVLVEQGLIFLAYLIEPAHLTLYNWIGFFGGLAYIIFVLPRTIKKEANG